MQSKSLLQASHFFFLYLTLYI